MMTIAQNCPNITDCRTIINGSDSATLQNNKIIQMCGGEMQKMKDEEKKRILDTELARVKAEADEAARKLADDEARLRTDEARGQTDGPAPIVPDEPTDSSSIMAAYRQPMRDAFLLPAALDNAIGDMSAGDVIVILFVLIIVLSLVYRRWSATKAQELKTLSGGVGAIAQAEARFLAHRMAKIKQQEEASARQGQEILAEMQPVGSF
jgi:hypothetical protein